MSDDADFEPISAHLTATASAEQISDRVRGFGLEFAKGADKVSRNTAAEHPYFFEGEIADRDKPYLAALGNAAKEKNLTQEEVNSVRAWFQKANSPEFVQREIMTRRETERQVQEIEKRHLADRLAAESVFSHEWGKSDYDHNVRAINKLLDEMPEDRRAILEDVNDEGKLRLNDIKVLRELAHEARSKTPSALAAEMKKTGLGELATLEALMRDARSVYWKSKSAADLQARYRTLIDGGTENPATTQANADEELATIQRLMATNPRQYFRDEKMQARFRELVDKKKAG